MRFILLLASRISGRGPRENQYVGTHMTENPSRRPGIPEAEISMNRQRTVKGRNKLQLDADRMFQPESSRN